MLHRLAHQIFRGINFGPGRANIAGSGRAKIISGRAQKIGPVQASIRDTETVDTHTRTHARRTRTDRVTERSERDPLDEIWVRHSGGPPMRSHSCRTFALRERRKHYNLH